MLIAEALRHAAATLAAAGVENPRREARLLAAHSLDLPAGAPIPADVTLDPGSYDGLVGRRAAREPLAYITGRRGFWSLELHTSPATLIPRPDSETLIEAALAHAPDRQGIASILDLGTGSGALLLAALTEFPRANGIGTDRSLPAIRLAAGNAARMGLSCRAAFVVADWTAPLAARFDLILCNPPYIRSDEIGSLMPEIACHEPITALDGGGDGLRAYASLLPTLPAHLTQGGLAILELGAGQSAAVREIAMQAGFTRIRARQDLAGIDRAILLAMLA